MPALRISRAEVRDCYLLAELSDIGRLQATLGRLPDNIRESLLLVLSRNIRKNELADCLGRYRHWKAQRVNIRNLSTGGIVGLDHIMHNNRHRLSDLAREPVVPIGLRGEPDDIPVKQLIGVADQTPIEDDDVSQNVRLIDGAHRAIIMAKAGVTEFGVYVGYED